MIIANANYEDLANEILTKDKKIIIYGAGMIGQIIVPYLMKEYNLLEHLVCFVDTDKRKKGSFVEISNKRFEITTPDYLESIDKNHVILISNSKFFSIIKYLDSIRNLDLVTGYIVPIMQINELEQTKPITIKHYVNKPIIPKKIHYCWFGRSKIPRILNQCIESWRINCPDYEIIEWNEDNYDVNRHPFTNEAYAKKKYGFVSDVARLDILYEHGGIYFDTDVLLIKGLDDLLYQEGFVGTEKWGNINTGGGCGFIPHHPMLKSMLNYRHQFQFVMDDGSLNLETNGLYETIPFLLEGFKPNNQLQRIRNVTIYPSYVNHPYDYMSCESHSNESTISVHHFHGGWMDEDARMNRKNTQDEYTAILERIANGGSKEDVTK